MGPTGATGDTGPTGPTGPQGFNQTDAELLYVSLTGDTMTGMLALPSTAPSSGTHATTKSYVDSRIWSGTQAQYNAIASPDPSVLYCII